MIRVFGFFCKKERVYWRLIMSERCAPHPGVSWGAPLELKKLIETRSRVISYNGATVPAVRFAGLVFLLFMLTNPCEFLIKGIVPGAAFMVDPRTTQAVYGNVVLQLGVKAGMLAACFLPLLLNAGMALRLIRRNPPLVLFVVYVAISTLWSETPQISVNDVIYLITAVSAGVVMTLYLDARRAALVFGDAGVAIMIASLAMVVLLPAYGLHQASEGSQGGHYGDWRGVYTHKNILGPLMAIFFTIYATQGAALFRRPAVAGAAALLALTLVVASHSASALVIIALCMSAYVVLFVLRGIPRIIVLMLLPICLVTLLELKETLLLELGRDADLSGRTDIWKAAFQIFWEQPLFGYGYGSATMGGLTAYLVERFKAQNTHNGYIDLLLSGGIIGSLLLYLSFATALYRAWRAWHVNSDAAVLIRVLVIFVLGWAAAAFSETALRPNTPAGALGLVAIVLLSSLPALPGRR